MTKSMWCEVNKNVFFLLKNVNLLVLLEKWVGIQMHEIFFLIFFSFTLFEQWILYLQNQ